MATIYKKGSVNQVPDSDLSYWLGQGWTTSPTASSTTAPAATTPKKTTTTSTPSQKSSPAPTPTPQSSAGVTVYKGTSTNTVPPSDLSYWLSKGWSQTKPASSAPATTPAPVTAPAPKTPETLNTVGLPEAAARRKAGTASATDLKNLNYAESKGWADPYKTTAPPVAAAPSATPNTSAKSNTPPAGSTYVSNPADLAGLTESQIWRDPSSARIYKLPGATAAPAKTGTSSTGVAPGLNTVGLPEAYARKVAGTATETDLRNLAYAETQGWKPDSASTKVSDPKQANDLINSEQDADIAAKTTSDEPTTRKTTEQIISEIKAQITPDEPAPTAPNFENALTDLNRQYGTAELQSSLNSLQDQQRQLLADYEALYGSERQKTVAMGVIEGRISEEERQANERLTKINNAIASVTDQLNTANSTISSIMSAKQLDYNTAAAAYKAEMDQNISLFNAAQGIEASMKTDEQNAIDNARSTAQILLNGYTAAGLSFEELTPVQQSSLTQLAVQSGFAPDFYQTVLSTTKEVQKDILTSVISDDKAYATIIYKDGTTATIPTGQPRSSNVPAGGSGGGGGSTSPEEKEIQKFRSDAATLIEKLDKREISWGTAWDQLHIKYPDASPALIDQMLGGGYNPSQEGANEQGYYGRGKVIAD